jgi:hypothetical protein
VKASIIPGAAAGTRPRSRRHPRFRTAQGEARADSLDARVIAAVPDQERDLAADHFRFDFVIDQASVPANQRLNSSTR